jgi:amino acid adenylation domain-containing protein
MQSETIEGFRLSPQQRHLWFTQRAVQNQPYRTQCLILIEGMLDTSVFHRAMEDVVTRHEILRTTFRCLPGITMPLQFISDDSILSLQNEDLIDLDPQEQETRIEALFHEASRLPFDFEHGTLLYTKLVTLSPHRHMLLVAAPALCSDTATLKNLMFEIGRSYAACLQNEERSDEPLQYADLSEWQNELLQEEDAETRQASWRKLDLSQPATVRLPFEGGTRRSRQGRTFTPQLLNVPMEEAICTQIADLAQQYDASPAAFLLACWQILLWHLTSQSNLVIGVACDGRHYQELVDTLGPYTRVVPLSSPFGEDCSLKQVVTQLNSSLNETIEQQQYFTWEQLSARADSDQEPPFLPLGFELVDWPTCFAAGPVRFSLHQHYSCTERFTLKLRVLQLGQNLHLELHYDPARLSTEHVKRLADCLLTLLHSAIAHPQAPVSSLELLSSDERQQLLQSCIHSATDYPCQPLHQLFEAQVERTPTKVAVACGSECLAYRQLNTQANQLAHFLRRQGVGPNVLVGLCLERSVAMIVGLLAILKAGGAYVPLDPDTPPARLTYQLRDIQARLVLTQERLLARLPEWEGQYICLDDSSAMLAEELDNPQLPSDLEDLAYVIYTSGSTGVPKGVMIRHRSVANYTHFMCRLIAPESGLHFATVSTLAADLGNTAIFCSLASGGCLHVLPYEIITDGQVFARYVSQHPLDVLKIVPSHLRALLAASSGRAILPRRYLVLGGEALSRALLKQIRALSSCCVINHYGPTETTIGVLVNVLGVSGQGDGLEQVEAEEEDALATVPVGHPVANTEAYVLDCYRRLVPVGVTGELYIGGAGLAAGYLHQPEQTEERFVHHPFSTQEGARVYKTGDLARYAADGKMEFLGRADSQVKLRGHRIELGEIEAVLGRHPNVWGCVVLLREEEPGEPYLIAYVVPRQQPDPTSAELRHFLQEQLPEHMVPAAFVLLQNLPLTANGKVDRKKLPLPQRSENRARSTYVAPRRPIEEVLVEIWEEVLKVGQVGIRDNFFNLGGHSLLATQVISHLRKVLQVEVPLRNLFEAPTIAGFAEHVSRALRPRQCVELPPLVPISRTQELPLSFAQQRLWFLDQLEPGSISYNLPVAVRLSGMLNVEAFERSLREIVRRHESLRTTFRTQEGQPVQVIGLVGAFRLLYTDLGRLTPEQRKGEARRLAQEERQSPFDLACGPLLRTMLLRLSEREYILLLSMHHIVSDGWSAGVFLHELSTLYNAFVHGRSSPLPELPIQYADFACWQRKWLQGEVLEAQLDYWTQQLKGAVPLELPTDHPRPAIQTFRGATQEFLVPAALSEDLKQLSQREGVTLFMTLLAAFQVLLARYTGQSDISVGSPIANRTHAEIEGLIGFFVNTLVLRTNLSGNPSFQDLLAGVREVTLGAYAHQDLPFEKLVEVLQPERDLSRSPLFQVVFFLRNCSAGSEELAGVTLQSLEEESVTAKFDLTLSMTETEQGLHAKVEYNTDLFEASTVSRLLRHFHILLTGIVAHPEQCLADLPLLSETECRQLLVDRHARRATYPVEECLHTLFEAQAQRTPDAVAVVYEDEQLTYAELNHRSSSVARHLHHLGVGPEVLVGLYMERSLEMVLGLLGVLKAGGAYVPLEPGYPQERLAFLLTDTQMPVILSQSHLQEHLPPHNAHVLCLDNTAMTLDEAAWAEVLPQQAVPASLAYVIYTSGSTGRPKGVLVSHANVVRLFAATQSWMNFLASDVWTLFHSYAFDFSVWELWGALLYGGRLVVVPSLVSRATETFYHLLAQQSVTVLNQTPSAFMQLMQVEEDPTQIEDLTLRLIIFGGEALDFQRLQPWMVRHGDSYPRLVNMYGITETTVHVTYRPLTWADVQGASGSLIGCPLPDLEIYILDEARQPVPIGVAGELYVGGAGLARGYLKRPELTSERFVTHPFSKQAGERLYKTGDRARYLASGEIEYLGRLDQQVKVRGFRIEVGEIETVLTSHPAVRESVVIVREDVPGDRRLVAYVVGGPQLTPSASELRKYVQQKMPDYMVPSVFVFVEALPLTANGKVDRRGLPRPNLSQVEVGANFVAPASSVEKVIADVWSKILGLDHVGVYDNFFNVGGHSLLATQLISRIRAVLQVELPLRAVFEAPTVAGLAERAEAALGAAPGLHVPSIVPVAREQDLPLSFAQQRLWFLEQLAPDSSPYTLLGAMRMQGVLNVRVLEQCLQEIVQRHESLRTTFIARAGRPVQVISTNMQIELEVMNLQTIAESRQATEVLRLADQAARCPFDLSRGPLLRIKLLRLSEHEHVLFLLMHHIISDAWSLGVLVRELFTHYETFSSGKPSPLPPLPFQYADFAVWQREWLQGEVLETHIDYWIKQLSGATSLQLPTDRPRQMLPDYRGASLPFTLSAQLSKALSTLSNQEGATLFMTLLAAFQALLYHYTGQQDIIVGTDIANRIRVETEDLIGFFVNLLVLRTNLGDQPSFREILRRVRGIVLDAYAHQDLPFEKLVDALQLERTTHEVPLVRVLFVLQNIPLPPLQLPQMRITPLEIEARAAKFDLAVFMWEGPQGLIGVVNYRSDLFDSSTIWSMIEHFDVLLQSIVASPDSQVDDLEMYSEVEKGQRANKENMDCETLRRRLKAARRSVVDLTASNFMEIN